MKGPRILTYESSVYQHDGLNVTFFGQQTTTQDADIRTYEIVN